MHSSAARYSRALIPFLALISFPVRAAETQLVINEVTIGKVNLVVEGLQGVTFEKCASVKVDDEGHVRVHCPGYDLKAAVPADASMTQAADAAPEKITKRYWLATEQTEPGGAQFDIDLYVNSKWIKRFRSDDEQAVLDITENLRPGKNKLLFAATKNLQGGRRSVSPEVYFRVVVGEGEKGGGNVMIDRPLVDLRRTAAEAQNISEEREIFAR